MAFSRSKNREKLHVYFPEVYYCYLKANTLQYNPYVKKYNFLHVAVLYNSKDDDMTSNNYNKKVQFLV